MAIYKKLRGIALNEKVVYTALSILRDNGKEMSISELMNRMEQEIEFDDWAKGGCEESGYVSRWKLVMQFFCDDCTFAGYLIIKDGIWRITPLGEEALTMSPEKLLIKITSDYYRWEQGLSDDSTSDHPIDQTLI